jgi:hypothetical protein
MRAHFYAAYYNYDYAAYEWQLHDKKRVHHTLFTVPATNSTKNCQRFQTYLCYCRHF